MTKRVAIYQDYVHNNGSLAIALQDERIDFYFVDAADILNSILKPHDFAALIMPGGADLYYCEKLNGQGNRLIRNYVESGGRYLGICAGAYYAAKALDWHDGEIAGPRELALIDTIATGPILDFVDYDASWYEAVDLAWQGQTFKTLYGAGPRFTQLQGADIIATYATLDHAPAVIGHAIGRGYAVLSSPHIEIYGDRFATGRYTHNANFETHERAVADRLRPDVTAQCAFFRHILGTLT